jgi:hypothetical protein
MSNDAEIPDRYIPPASREERIQDWNLSAEAFAAKTGASTGFQSCPRAGMDAVLANGYMREGPVPYLVPAVVARRIAAGVVCDGGALLREIRQMPRPGGANWASSASSQ